MWRACANTHTYTHTHACAHTQIFEQAYCYDGVNETWDGRGLGGEKVNNNWVQGCLLCRCCGGLTACTLVWVLFLKASTTHTHRHTQTHIQTNTQHNIVHYTALDGRIALLDEEPTNSQGCMIMDYIHSIRPYWLDCAFLQFRISIIYFPLHTLACTWTASTCQGHSHPHRLTQPCHPSRSLP